MITEYAVTGMTCEHCEQRVQQEIAGLAGVTAVEADAASGSVHVTSTTSLDPAAVAAAVDEAGYELARG